MIVNGEQVGSIIRNGETIHKVVRNGIELYGGQHPNMVCRWSAKGKTNQDADRATLKDLSGHGRDVDLKNFAFVEGSGYSNDGLVFDGIDDKGIISTLKQLNDFTFIAKRKILSVADGYYPGVFCNDNSSFEYGYKKISNVRSLNSVAYISAVPELISYMTPTSYNGLTIPKGNAPQSVNSYSAFGSHTPGGDTSVMNMILYDFIVYDRTLTTEEIQLEILKYNL